MGYDIVFPKDLNTSVENDSIEANKKKGFTDLIELHSTNTVGYNKNYVKAYNHNKAAFLKKNGGFTAMYDEAIKAGKLNMPFGPRNQKTK